MALHPFTHAEHLRLYGFTTVLKGCTFQPLTVQFLHPTCVAMITLPEAEICRQWNLYFTLTTQKSSHADISFKITLIFLPLWGSMVDFLPMECFLTENLQNTQSACSTLPFAMMSQSRDDDHRIHHLCVTSLASAFMIAIVYGYSQRLQPLMRALLSSSIVFILTDTHGSGRPVMAQCATQRKLFVGAVNRTKTRIRVITWFTFAKAGICLWLTLKGRPTTMQEQIARPSVAKVG